MNMKLIHVIVIRCSLIRLKLHSILQEMDGAIEEWFSPWQQLDSSCSHENEIVARFSPSTSLEHLLSSSSEQLFTLSPHSSLAAIVERMCVAGAPSAPSATPSKVFTAQKTQLSQIFAKRLVLAEDKFSPQRILAPQKGPLDTVVADIQSAISAQFNKQPTVTEKLEQVASFGTSLKEKFKSQFASKAVAFFQSSPSSSLRGSAHPLLPSREVKSPSPDPSPKLLQQAGRNVPVTIEVPADSESESTATTATATAGPTASPSSNSSAPPTDSSLPYSKTGSDSPVRVTRQALSPSSLNLLVKLNPEALTSVHSVESVESVESVQKGRNADRSDRSESEESEESASRAGNESMSPSGRAELEAVESSIIGNSEAALESRLSAQSPAHADPSLPGQPGQPGQPGRQVDTKSCVQFLLDQFQQWVIPVPASNAPDAPMVLNLAPQLALQMLLSVLETIIFCYNSSFHLSDQF